MQFTTHGWRLRALAARYLAIAMALASGAPASALNPEIRLRDYNHATWTSRDGAPAEIRSMAQTPDGWLWLGTSTGLFRFDGQRFEHYAAASQGPIAKRRVNELRASAAGDLWISYSVGGLSVLRKNGKMEDLLPLDSEVGSIFTLAVEGEGEGGGGGGDDLWISGSNGLFNYAQGRLLKLGPEQGLPQEPPRTVLLDQYRQLWVLYRAGAYRLDRSSGRFTLMHAQANEGTLLQSPDGRMWISDLRQLYPLPLEKTLPHGQSRVLPRPALFNSLESREAAQFDRDGNLWTRHCPQALCVLARVGQRNDGALTTAAEATDTLDPQLGLTSRATNAVMEDMEGNIWIATQSGLDRFRENSLIPVPLPKASGAFSMAGDTEGGVWLTDSLNEMTWRLSASGVPELSPSFYVTLANDRDGALLMAGKRDIERRYRGQTTRIPLPPNRNGQAVDLDVGGLQDDGKVLWMASPQTGLMGYIDGRWQPRSAFNLPQRIFLGAAGRKPGERWQATGDATMVFNDNGKLTTYDAKLIGLATMISVNQDVVIGGDQGLAVFQNNGFRKLKAARPEALANISGMAISANGDRWFNGGKGVVHVRRADWLAALAQPDALLRYQLLGALDGYTGQAMLATRLPSVYSDGAGNIWFMTSGGVLRLAPAQLRRNSIAPVPLVQNIEAGATSYDAVPGLRLPPGAQNFSVQFTAPGLGKPEAMRFQYQLSGVDEEWQEAGGRRVAYYTNVAPGSYTFRVRAFNDSGVASAQDALLEFEIAPRFVQTIWFKALCGLGLAAVLYLLYLYRLRAATRRVAEQLTVRMAERERIARTLHDTFLQSVQALILRLDVVSHGLPEEARRKLEPILDQANDTVIEGRDQVYELRTGRVDDVESAAAEAGRQLHAAQPGTVFNIVVSGPRRKLLDAVAEEACEIAREALRNAFQHAGATRVETRVVYECDQFVLLVDDDGIGIGADAADKPKHYGLTGMRERAARAGGKLEIGASPSGGARIRFTVPARAAYADVKRWWRPGAR